MDWIKAGKYVRTPSGSVKEILFVSEDNGVKLDDHKYYCASELQPASKPIDTDATNPTIEWWDYEKNEPLDFPPAGTECAINFMGTWTKTLIIGFASDGSCIYEHDLLGLKYYFPIEVGDINVFRPLSNKPKLTERQQAGLKLWRAINRGDTRTDEGVMSLDRFEDYCKVYDQGLLK